MACFRTQPWSVWEGPCGKFAAVATVEAAGVAAVVVAAPRPNRPRRAPGIPVSLSRHRRAHLSFEA